MPITLIIADDHALVREGLRKFVELEKDLKIVGEASTAEEALELVAKEKPQIVVMDLSMPQMGGIAAIEEVTKSYPEVKVIALTMHEELGYLMEAIRAGVKSFLLKDLNPKQIIQAIRIVAEGGAYLPPRLLDDLLAEVSQLLNKKEEISRKDGLDSLTEREREILTLITRGKTNAEIAEDLIISPLTVKNHVSSILYKLGLSDRTQAAVYAQKMGIE